jgi:hypothetical protein
MKLSQRGANLQTADLRGADLQTADLQAADLQAADLQAAYLRNTDLRNADLRNADLRNADLRNADLRNADLQAADLRNANLDFSCFPLWCGSFNMHVSVDLIQQLLYHLCRLKCDDPEWLSIRENIQSSANKAGIIGRHDLPLISAMEVKE